MPASPLRSSAAYQFSTGHLFYLLWLCATATALLGWPGIPLAGFVLLVWMQILAGARREAEAAGIESDSPYSSSRGGTTKFELLVVLFIAAMLIGLFMPAASEYDPMQQAATSMKMVARAVAAYEQQHGRLPPVVVTNQVGLPLHSWRSLILPYLEEEKLAASYRYDQPWNSSFNSELLQYRPWHLRTYYPESEEQRELSSLQLMRDAQQNWFVVEHEQACTPWLQPTEPITWSQLEQLPTQDQGFWRRGFFTSSYLGRLAVSAEQTITIHPHRHPDLSRPQRLEECMARCARTGSETAVLGTPYRQLHWDNALRLAMFLVAVLYPLRWLSTIRQGR